MIARLWWKEARQVWPVWGFLAAVGLGLQTLVRLYWGGDSISPGGFAYIALVMTMMYLFLIAAAAFAGERENRTLGLLDAIPVERWRVWTAKATFALATTTALGVLLWLGALLFNGWNSEAAAIGVVAVVWGLTGLGWGLLWSSVLGNALFAAVTAMFCLSVSLLGLVDLNYGQVHLQSVPYLLILAVLTTAASAAWFLRSGPPHGVRRRRVPRCRPVEPASIEAPSTASDVDGRHPPRAWAYAATRLAWATLRELRSTLWLLVLAFGVAIPTTVLNVQRDERNLLIWLVLATAALVTGVNVFNGENRGRTHRFLLQHGARPGMVWLVKIVPWWLFAALLWTIVGTSAARTFQMGPNTWITSTDLIAWSVVGLSIGFALAVLCGMAFRRGITAGLIALVASIVVYGLIAALLSAGAFYPTHLIYILIALLLVSWLWSGDWLLDRPGAAKWIRLASYLAGACVALTSAYIANRAWSVPKLPRSQAGALFQFDRIAAPVRDVDNAAPLYREGYQLSTRVPMPELAPDRKLVMDVHGQAFGLWDEKNPAVAEYLRTIEPALALIRQAARKPACRYGDLRTMTQFTTTTEPPIYYLAQPLIISARVRLERGDLPGAWAELETLLRMSRHYSHVYPVWSSRMLEPLALGMAMQWAADPRQTAATLEAGHDALEQVPAPASKADRVRVDALVSINTLAQPRQTLAEDLFFRWNGGRKNIDPIRKLVYDLQTTPWEILRARRVTELLAAAAVQQAEMDRATVEPGVSPYGPERWPTVLLESEGGPEAVGPWELEMLSQTTSLSRETLPWTWRVAGQDQTDEVARRALEIIFRLRVYQARHDGALPRTLSEVNAAGEPTLLDVFSGKPFGYVPAPGHGGKNSLLLPPLGLYQPMTSYIQLRPRLSHPAGCMLLYSVGSDRVDDRAAHNLDPNGKGDILFPLKDGVKPPESK